MSPPPTLAAPATRRLRLAAACALAAALGIATKHASGPARDILVGQGEDFFGTVFLILAPRLAFLRLPLWKIALPVLAIVVAIELSQLSHAGWLERIRAHWLGIRIVGTHFEWADLLAYALGAAAAMLIDRRAARPG